MALSDIAPAMPLSPSGRLSIDLNAIRENYAFLCSKTTKGCQVAAVIKADAYGLGAVPVAQALLDAGCSMFFVSSPGEALLLREHFADCSILVLNGFYASHAGDYPDRNLIPVLGSFLEIETYKALVARIGRPLPAFLNFNIRMNRLGLGRVETEKLLRNLNMLEELNIKGIMSHFACADEADHPLTAEQYSVFKKIAAHFPKADKSLCNSAGFFRDQAYHFDIARPGMALFGLNPTPEAPNPMKPVIKLDVPVIRLRLVYKGASIGYGATHRFEKDTWVATVSAGYADGLFRSLSGGGALYWKGYRCPIRGRLSMDLTSVDLSAVPEAQRPRPGDFLEVVGDHQSADDLAKDAGTIGYEILTALGTRYQRNYTS